MIHLTGQYLGAQHVEARVGKDGTRYPERFRLQIMTREVLENGSEAIDIQHLTTDEDTAKVFSAKIGQTISVPVRPYVAGRAVAFAIQRGAQPLPALSKHQE